MEILATLQKSVKAGTSVWTFGVIDGEYLATNNAGKRIRCSNVEDLRRFYKTMIGYGFLSVNEESVCYPED